MGFLASTTANENPHAFRVKARKSNAFDQQTSFAAGAADKDHWIRIL
jgi:hypothetical protein